MHIYTSISKGQTIGEAHLPLLYALEGINEFEEAVWQSRGLLGVNLNELFGSPKISEAQKRIYKEAYKRKPDWHISADEAYVNWPIEKQNTYFANHSESIKCITDEADKFQSNLLNEAKHISTEFHLPASWAYGISGIIFNNIFSIDVDSPILLQIVGKDLQSYIKNYAVKPKDNILLASYFGNHEGIGLTITADITKHQLHEWIDDNFIDIMALTSASNMAKYWHSQAHFKLLRKTWLLRQVPLENGKPKGRAAIAKQLSVEEGRVISADDVSSYLKDYRRYMRKYEKKLRLG